MRELAMRVVPDGKTTISSKSFSITEALAIYHRLKGNGKKKLLKSTFKLNGKCKIQDDNELLFYNSNRVVINYFISTSN